MCLNKQIFTSNQNNDEWFVIYKMLKSYRIIVHSLYTYTTTLTGVFYCDDRFVCFKVFRVSLILFKYLMVVFMQRFEMDLSRKILKF